MDHISIDTFTLAGIRLPGKTTNSNEQSSRDCGALWQRFEQEKIANKIAGKLDNAVRAVYFDYDGDHTQPFSYFIGCRVDPKAVQPDGLEKLTIPSGTYKKIVARGKMPYCIMNAWREIWSKDDSVRGYAFDFEVYDQRSYDWSNAEVDILLSLK